MACRTKAEIAEAHLLQACTIQRGTRVTDGAGGSTITYVTVLTTVCRVSPYGNVADIERSVAERLGGRPAYKVKVPTGTDVLLDDRLVVEARTLEVISKPSDAPGATLCAFIASDS